MVTSCMQPSAVSFIWVVFKFKGFIYLVQLFEFFSVFAVWIAIYFCLFCADNRISNRTGVLDRDEVIFSLHPLPQTILSINDRHITFPSEGKFAVCATRYDLFLIFRTNLSCSHTCITAAFSVSHLKLGDFRGDIGGDVLEPAGLGEEELIFLAHPEMIVARIFLQRPLQDDEALLMQNLKIYNKPILSGTFYEDIAKDIGNDYSAFALIKVKSVLIPAPVVSPLSLPTLAEKVCYLPIIICTFSSFISVSSCKLSSKLSKQITCKYIHSINNPTLYQRNIVQCDNLSWKEQNADNCT